ncbi:MAG: hypothetical protein ABIU85_06480, partial [Methylotenera sp.]
MNDSFYFKTGLFSNYRNSVKKSFIPNARTPFFYQYDVVKGICFSHGFSPAFSFRSSPKSSSSLAVRARAFSPYHYLVNPPFW